MSLSKVKKLIFPFLFLTLSSTSVFASSSLCLHFYSHEPLSQKIQTELRENPHGHKVLLVADVLRADIASLTKAYSKISERLGDNGKNNPIRMTWETTEAAIAEFHKIHGLLEKELDSLKQKSHMIDGLSNRFKGCLLGIGKCLSNIPPAMEQIKEDLQDISDLITMLEFKRAEINSTLFDLLNKGSLESADSDQLASHMQRQDDLFVQYQANLDVIKNHIKSIEKLLVNQKLGIYGIETQAAHLEARGIRGIDLLDIFSTKSRPIDFLKEQKTTDQASFEEQALEFPISQYATDTINTLRKLNLNQGAIWTKLFDDVVGLNKPISMRDLFEITKELIHSNKIPMFNNDRYTGDVTFSYTLDNLSITNEKLRNYYYGARRADNLSFLYFLTGSKNAETYLKFNTWIKKEIDSAYRQAQVDVEIAKSSLTWQQKIHLAKRDSKTRIATARVQFLWKIKVEFNTFLLYQPLFYEILNLVADRQNARVTFRKLLDDSKFSIPLNSD